MLQSCDRIYCDSCFLRKIESSKDLDIWSKWFNDSEVLKYSVHRNSKTTPEKQNSILKKINDSDKKFQYMICLADESQVGVISILFEKDFKYGNISIIIGEKKVWGKGIATSAIKGLSRKIKSMKPGLKINAGCDSRNIGSRKAFEKAGFKLIKNKAACIKYDDESTLYDMDILEL